MSEEYWERYPRIREHPSVRAWLEHLRTERQLAPATLSIYARALEDYLAFYARLAPVVPPEQASPKEVAAYQADLLLREDHTTRKVRRRTVAEGLAPGTVGLRLTVVRLYYAHLVEREYNKWNPVEAFLANPELWAEQQPARPPRDGVQAGRWLPTEQEWRRLLEIAARRSARDKAMLALAYDAALRSEELVALELADLDQEERVVTVPARPTARGKTRHVPYSAITARLLDGYLGDRPDALGPITAQTLFVSESNRTRGRRLSPIMWSKIVERLAGEADLPRFSTRTLRQLRLAHLAGAGLPLEEIEQYLRHHNSWKAMPDFRRAMRAANADNLAILLGGQEPDPAE